MPVPTPQITVPSRLSARTLAWLADRPHTSTMIRSIWNELAELERAGNHPDVRATLRFILFEYQILTRTGRCHGCRRGRRRGTWRWLWRRSFPCEVWFTVRIGLQGLFARPPVGPGEPETGRHVVRTSL
ncbi:MAG: hypothetical protein ACRDQ4_07710 [Pseudonocardiaceae bacterium]